MTRKRVSITLPKECVEWIDSRVRERVYGNRSHAIEALVLGAMKQEPTLTVDSNKAAWLHKKEKPRAESGRKKQ